MGQDLLKQSKMRPAVSSVTAYAKHLEINLQYHYLKGICRSLTFLLCFRPSKGAPYVESLCLWERKKAKLPSCVRLFATPWTVARQAPLSMGFPGQRILKWVPFPSPEALPNPEIKPISSALAGGLFTNEPLGKPTASVYYHK